MEQIQIRSINQVEDLKDQENIENIQDLEDLEKEVQRRIKLILSIGDCIQTNELVELVKYNLANKNKNRGIACYNGFEPSGWLTFAQCMIAVINVNKLTSCGFKFIFWIADWFAQLNGKFGGDLKKIRKAGELMIETFRCAGMDMSKVEFKWASEEIGKNPEKYWSLVMDISMKFTTDRVKRCTPALGRESNDQLPFSTMMYAVMQCADIFYLNVDICQLGEDQLKVNMLAREYSSKIGKKHPPIILSHKLLAGLKGQTKMAKSDPNNAIFMNDSPADIKRKINKGYMPEGNNNNKEEKLEKNYEENYDEKQDQHGNQEQDQRKIKEEKISKLLATIQDLTDEVISLSDGNICEKHFNENGDLTEIIFKNLGQQVKVNKEMEEVKQEEKKEKEEKGEDISSDMKNPILQYLEYIIFPLLKLKSNNNMSNFKIERPEKHGGDVEYLNYLDLLGDYQSGKVHPMDIKAALIREINSILIPYGEYFTQNLNAKQLLNTVKNYKI